jgi:hypothetical protein
MAEILEYSRNRCTSVEQVDEQTLRSVCRLQDTLTEAVVEITATLPDLEIADITGNIIRTYEEACRKPADSLQKVVGVRVGPGVLKIIKGLIGKQTDCKQLAFMVEECCHGIILAFTKDMVKLSPKDKSHPNAIEFYNRMVRDNVRLYNRCAAFAPGSPLVEGIEAPT